MSTDEQLIYWHRELPPLGDEIADEYVVEARSAEVPDSHIHREAQFEACLPGLKAELVKRLEQEVRRLGGSCAHVLGEHIEPHIDNANARYRLDGRLSYVLYKRPAT